MKLFTEIQLALNDQIGHVANLEKQHSKLNQVDTLSGEGFRLRERINQTKGMIKAFGWILNDDIINL